MNTYTIIANIVIFATFIIHTFWGDKDLRIIEPSTSDCNKFKTWVMARAAFHMVSVDFLLATIIITVLNCTNFFIGSENLILQLLSVYFLLYSIGFLITILISKKFKRNYLQLGQWILLLVISGILYIGI
jgi:hypothetical protein